MIVQLLDLDLDKENELIFKLSVMGTKPATTKSRFLLEYDNFSLSFPAKNLPEGEVSVLIPPLENIILEGRYNGSLEVIIDEKVVFTPMKVTTDFKKSVNIVAEVVTNRRPETKVTVSQVISVNKKQSEADESRVSPTQLASESTIIPPAALKKSEPRLENIIESRSVSASEDLKRKRPPQRSRKRPAQTEATSRNKSKRLIETKIKDIAKSKDVSISKTQMEKIVQLLKNRGNKK
tara:strand:- start:27 stop:734 length:708 start_codon:yes stop_codon:yes gene_type:complete